MLLLDKGYFDYDFERKTEVKRIRTYEETVMSDEETKGFLLNFGFSQFQEKKPETLEEIQEHIIKQERYGS